MTSKSKKVFCTILIALIVIVAGICGMASMQPDQFRYERETVMNAPAAEIFANVNDLTKWGAWSPWKDFDPNMQMTMEGPAAGVGAKTSWKGNANAGEGSMTITESVPDQKIAYRLDFIKPFKSTAMSDFTLEPQGSSATLVKWTMYGDNTFPGKIVSLFLDCEKMMNEQFDKGLNRLKAVVEQ